MANTKNAEKAIRKIAKRTAVNKSRRTRVRNTWRGVEEALAKGDAAAAQTALKSVETETMRAVTKGVMHKNAASRKVSRLTQRVKALAGTKKG
jgi:small subunit ribosomal protein S20